MGKDNQKKPCMITVEERRIREQLAYGKITFNTFRKKYLALKKKGLIKRGTK